MSRTDGEHRLIAAGFGGQGVLTLGRLICLAAMAEGRTVTYMPAYGTEVRGGTANCQVVVSSARIYSPLVERADSLIVLNQLSLERFGARLNPGGLILVNSSGVEPEAVAVAEDARLVAVPAAEKAAEMGDVRVGNVLMLGAFARAGGLVTAQSCRRALGEVFGGAKADMLGLNLDAFEAGLGAVPGD